MSKKKGVPLLFSLEIIKDNCEMGDWGFYKGVV